MPTTYAYKVRDRQGKLVEGQLEADSSALVVNRLRQMGYTPVAIDRRDTSTLQKEIHVPGLGNRVRLKDVAVFSRQFATMVNAGLTLLRALSILGEQTENTVLAGIVNEVRQEVERGSSLSQAMARHPKAFSRLYVAMVRAGETGGVLDAVLLQLAENLEKQVALRQKVRSAMTYPVAVFFLVVTILTAMLLFVVPMFQDLYADLGGTLPVPTRVLLGVSSVAKTFAVPIFVLEGVGIWALRRWLRTPAGRARWDALALRLPVFGKLVRKTALTRFARTLAVLLRSGVPILESLEITAETVNNAVVAKGVRDTQTAVKRGEAVAKPLAEHPVFPPMVTQMMAVGEETGALDDLLDKVGDFYDQEVEATVDSLTSLLEPVMIVVMGASVGAMVVALYLPMFNIINLIK
ncbi:MAG TPA: type II secretion system F family protein [Acidimicrobiales bacterium]